MVLKLDDGEGNVVLSKKRADVETVWDDINEYHTTKKNIKIKISEVVKGGVTSYINGIRAFLPASLISTKYVENLNEYVGKELDAKVIEYNQEDKKIILSAKEAEIEIREAKKKELLSKLEKGNQIEGTVTRLAKFGAFVDIGGIDGLIRNQDLAWKHVKDPSEIVKEGDKVKVTILDVDVAKERISLGLKDISQDPWTTVQDKFKVGQIIDGKVEKLMDFGAFVSIANGIEGLVHVSEISEKRVQKPSDVLKAGEKIKVKIIDMSIPDKRISLSMKEVENDENKTILTEFNDTDEATTSLKGVFADILKQLK